MILKTLLELKLRVSEHLILLIALAIISGVFVHNNVLWRWDNLVYDAQLSLWNRPAPEDVIIIAIDDESLNEIGRWPWPRSKYAELINKLERESPRAIGLDIIFSEPDVNDPASDALLAEAMKNSRKVVLPLFMAQENRSSYPIEALPLPVFTQNAAALGHVHIDVSDDGIARRVFLKEGIDKPHWMHYGLAMLSIIDETIERVISSKNVQDNRYSSMRWSREHSFFIPYAGPPGHFQQIGFSQVMKGQYSNNLFNDKIVLVGATAEGLSDSYPTPLSGSEGKMPGVEIIANVIDAIQQDIHITELRSNTLIFVTILLVALPILIFPLLNPASAFIALSFIVAITIALIQALLMFGHQWIPLPTILLFQLMSYPLWSWRRLALAMKHINDELQQLSIMQLSLRIQHIRNLTEEIKFVSQLIPVKAWVLLNEKNNPLEQHGIAPILPMNKLKPNQLNTYGVNHWIRTSYQNKSCKLGITLEEGAVLNKKEKDILTGLIIAEKNADQQHGIVEDVLDSKILQLKSASDEYQELRRIIDESMSAMADGVIICDVNGQIMLANQRAGWYLYGDDNAVIEGKPILDELNTIQSEKSDDWSNVFKTVLLKRVRVINEARHRDGRDLNVAITPLSIKSKGFVVNLSDVSLLKANERNRSEVLNFLSHDLRSPLSSIIAMIELAENKTDLGGVKDMLTGMKSNTHKTLHLAEQFLQLSRVNAHEKINFYETDFNTNVLNAIDQLWGLASKKQITIKHEFKEEDIWIMAEPDLLERAILNLITNAINYSAAETIISVTVTLENNMISCCISDQGAGIAADELPHLFEMFRRAQHDGSPRTQGIGLGLAFVDAVAKRHGGKVNVESEQGKGSVFCIEFPRA